MTRRYLHISADLVVVPKVALGTDGKPAVVPGEFEYRVGKGVTYNIGQNARKRSRREQLKGRGF